MELQWWSIEVCDGRFPASQWRRAHGEELQEALLTNGAYDWTWTVTPFGIVLEVGFRSDGAWERFRALPVVTAALDAVPDPINGRFVYPGRGGSSGASQRRRSPRPLGAGAAALPISPPPSLVARPLEALPRPVDREPDVPVRLAA
ncbi:hypothetical protein Val02_17030 [Virgisporangium aliadipatigenens]|uniref:Uncharacterized protein n=1 Tax=Virgisporangium aliadipatigenens TaxID=741659 RepID=A0A8J4DPW3_9ACTN|nr:hypothetical protein [Virgisporangium aliadipatigenens]GIJ44817.1 hypothetical protein Val02_17030 [Virgisporangium aliadipatigenens]